MKISLSPKPYIIKVSSFFIVISLVAGIPSLTNASDDNIQTMSLSVSESSINPDLYNADEPADPIIGQDGSFIYSEDLYIPDVKFEKSPLSDQISIYTVEEGDTLSEIAESFDVSVNTIRWENNISGQTISIGQKLNILPVTGVKHIVKSGDTISKIADEYEAETEDILIFNGLLKEDVLKIGDIIFVPNGIIKTVVSTSTSSSSSSYTTSSNTKVQSGYYIRPVSGIITSPYGPRRGGFHPGVDLGGARGTPVKATASGVIVQVVNGCVEGRKSCGGGYGNHIVIEHPNGTKTRYAHLSKTYVSVGQDVSQGQKIGAIGSTGNSTGPHLHFEIQNSNGSKMRPPF